MGFIIIKYIVSDNAVIYVFRIIIFRYSDALLDHVNYSFPCLFFFFFMQKTAYDVRISGWSSDVCSSDLAGGVDDHGEREVALAGAQPGLGDALDRGLQDADQFDVRAVEGLVIAALLRHPPRAEAVILRNQPLGDRGVRDARADLAGDEVGQQGVGLAVDQHVAEVALPDAEAGLGIALLPERLALLRRHLEGAAGVDRVDEAGGGLAAALEDLVVAGADRLHPGLVDRRSEERWVGKGGVR